MTTTPETNAFLNKELAGERIQIGDWTVLCRRLERERNAAARALAAMRMELDSMCNSEELRQARAERDDAIAAFLALREFCETELGWMYFRAEFLQEADERRIVIKNARNLQRYLAKLKIHP